MTEKEKLIKKWLIDYHGLWCWGCDVPITEPQQLELDHNIPSAEGGSDTSENRSLLCSPCNKQKGDRLTILGLRDEIKKGIGGRGVRKPSTFDIEGAVRMNRLHHENTLRGEPIQGEFSLERVIKDVEENPTPPVHPDPVLNNVIGLLWHRGYTDLATTLQDAIRIEPLVYQANQELLHSCNIVFKNGDTKEIVAFDSARGKTKISIGSDSKETLYERTLAILEAVATATGFLCKRNQWDVYSLETIRVMFDQPIPASAYDGPGVDDVDDLPF
jgi:hypothetical protein